MFQAKIRIIVRPEACVLSAFALFLIPWQWVFAWVFAAIFHELCHYIVLRLWGCRVSALQIGIGGIVMQTDGLSPAAETICAAAGPFGSLILTLLSPIFPRIAVCGFFHFLYNLLPVYPQDGGRVFCGILMCVLPTVWAERITQITGSIVVFLLMIIAIYGSMWLSMGLFPLIAVLFLMLKIKFPCKRKQLRVQ